MRQASGGHGFGKSDGKLPKKCRELVSEWAQLHQQELIDMWDSQNFHTIAPLEK
ncbi:MAG: DUF4160 domain-containing protein [Methylomonas sp.]